MTTSPDEALPVDDDLVAFLQKADPALLDRLASDPQAYIDLLTEVNAAGGRSDALVTDAVAAARHAGCTWQEIGEALDSTAQAAEDHHGPALDQRAYVADAAAGTVQRMRLFPVTAFDEITVLNRAGLYGWHSVGCGIAYHTIERDTHQWTHATTMPGVDPGPGDWQIACQWMFITYWARRLDTPALPGDPTRHQLISGRGLPGES